MQTIFEPDALERKENQLQLFFTRIVLFAKYIFHIKKKHLKKVEMIMLIITTGCRVSASQMQWFSPRDCTYVCWATQQVVHFLELQFWSPDFKSAQWCGEPRQQLDVWLKTSNHHIRKKWKHITYSSCRGKTLNTLSSFKSYLTLSGCGMQADGQRRVLFAFRAFTLREREHH